MRLLLLLRRLNIQSLDPIVIKTGNARSLFILSITISVTLKQLTNCRIKTKISRTRAHLTTTYDTILHPCDAPRFHALNSTRKVTHQTTRQTDTNYSTVAYSTSPETVRWLPVGLKVFRNLKTPTSGKRFQVITRAM